MIPYSSEPISELSCQEGIITSFIKGDEKNIDAQTVKSFGEEWAAFHQFATEEIEKIGNDYFDLLSFDTSSFNALDVGCGSGRWVRYLAPRVRFIEAIDPSDAVFVAKKMLRGYKNTRVTQASVANMPFPDSSFDLVYSLGVLHHVPDTQDAIQQCFNKVKKGGYFLIYLYYNLDNRGGIFKWLFNISNIFRKKISALSPSKKKIICDCIAAFIYWPLATTSSFVELFSQRIAKQIPLSYYRNTSFFVMRNDALDRFGTPLEKRFSKQEITDMLTGAGFVNIQFSSREPYWHALAQK